MLWWLKIELLLTLITFFQTLYLLKTRVEPNSGGELCRASTICSLSITIELVGEITPEHREKYSSVMYEVNIKKIYRSNLTKELY